MSEYQYVVFQAVDGPLNDKQLEFARRQSSRAEVTRWSMSCEYHYSSFRGDVDGLLRGGYDVYLQYTNYGCREIKLRLANGLPVDQRLWSQYVDGEQLEWKRDAKSRGGILTLQPYHEAGDLPDVWDVENVLDAVVRLRTQLATGDLRALYVLWLCAASDDNNDPETTIEPPVPHGIVESASYGQGVLEFFGLDPLLIAAAGSGVASSAGRDSASRGIDQWLASLSHEDATQALRRMLTGDATGEKTRMLAAIRDSQTSDAWPTSDLRRSFDELLRATEALRAAENAKQARKAGAKAKRKAAAAERQRAARLKEMVQAPDKWLHEAERLVDAKGTSNYQAAAEILHDLREAIGGDKGKEIARRHAVHLAKKYPTFTRLKGSLRKRGLLDS